MRIRSWLESHVSGVAAPRRRPALLAAIVVAWLLAIVPLAPAFAQTPPATPAPQSTQVKLSCGPNSAIPDVVLDVPNLSVDEISVVVDKLAADLNLDAKVASLVQIHAGLTVSVDKVQITIKGIKVEVHLTVCLDNVRQIVTAALQTLNQNPQLVTALLNTVNNAVNTVGGVVNNAVSTLGPILSTTLNSLGQTVNRTIDTLGNIVEQTVSTAGAVLGQTVVAALSSLPVLSQTVDAAGQTVKQVQDTTGAVIELVQDAAGNFVSSRVITKAP